MAGVDHLDLAQFGVKAQEDCGYIAATSLFALAPMVLIHARGQFIEGRAGNGHGAERGAETGGHHGRGQSFARDISHHDQ